MRRPIFLDLIHTGVDDAGVPPSVLLLQAGQDQGVRVDRGLCDQASPGHKNTVLKIYRQKLNKRFVNVLLIASVFVFSRACITYIALIKYLWNIQMSIFIYNSRGCGS